LKNVDIFMLIDYNYIKCRYSVAMNLVFYLFHNRRERRGGAEDAEVRNHLSVLCLPLNPP